VLIRRSIVLFLVLSLLAPTLPTGHAGAASKPPNDSVDKARLVASVPYEDELDTSGATNSASDPYNCATNASVWYKFTPSKSGGYQFSTGYSNYDTRIGVYVGKPDHLSIGPCAEDSSTHNLTTTFTVTLVKNTTYFILIAGNDGGGDLHFAVNFMSSVRMVLKIKQGEEYVSTTSVPVGASMAADLSGFTTDSYCTVYLLRGSKKIFLNESFPDGWGVVAVFFTVPSVPAGVYTVEVVQTERTQTVKTATLTIVSTVAVSPSRAARGDKVTLSFRGFAASERIRIQWWDGSTWRDIPSAGSSSTRVTTNVNGSSNVTVKIPSFAPIGNDKVRATGATSSGQTTRIKITG
jgi:hypothetical protein